MTQDQISAHFRALQKLAQALAGADLPDGERDAARAAVDSALQIVESIVLDINRIAAALERSDR